jgi:hypothetical protein
MSWKAVGAVALCAACAAATAGAQGCDDLPATTLSTLAADNPLAALSAVGKVKAALDAYFDAPDGKKLDAAAKSIAESGIKFAFGPGAGILITAGKFSYDGVEWTMEEAARLRVDAQICGTVAFGEQVPMPALFKDAGVQAIAPGVTCENFGEWVNTPEKFQRLQEHYKGHFTRTFLGLHPRSLWPEKQAILDSVWKEINRIWHVREADRQLKKLQLDLMRKAEALQKGCPRPDFALPPDRIIAAGAEPTDPADLPEPALPREGMLILVETVVTKHPVDPSIVIAPAPLRSTITSYWGEATCSWSAPPKGLRTEEVFGFDFDLSGTSFNGQRHTQTLVVKSGFRNVGNLMNEIAIHVEPGASPSAKGHLELGVGDLAHAADYVTWYLQVGGCGANVDFVYKLKKP